MKRETGKVLAFFAVLLMLGGLFTSVYGVGWAGARGGRKRGV